MINYLNVFRQRAFVENQLDEPSRKKVAMLVSKLLDMNIYELKYFGLYNQQKLMKTAGISPLKMNLDWPSVKRDGIIFDLM